MTAVQSAVPELLWMLAKMRPDWGEAETAGAVDAACRAWQDFGRVAEEAARLARDTGAGPHHLTTAVTQDASFRGRGHALTPEANAAHAARAQALLRAKLAKPPAGAGEVT